MKEMEFSTPLYTKSKPGLKDPSERRVLISDPSITKNSNMDVFGEVAISVE